MLRSQEPSKTRKRHATDQGESSHDASIPGSSARYRPATEAPNITNRVLGSSAAKFNEMILRKLRKAFEDDPEVDLVALIPSAYSEMLLSRRQRKAMDSSQDIGKHHVNGAQVRRRNTPPMSPTSIASFGLRLLGHETTIVFPLSDEVKRLAQDLCNVNQSQEASLEALDLSNILAQCTPIWQSETNAQRFVAKCGPELIIKCVSSPKDHTEYTSLLYLERHAPKLRVPRVHGLVICGGYAFLFMSFIPGMTLSTVWPTLDESARKIVCCDVNKFFEELRCLRKPVDAPFGGVADEGCKDTRRHTRVSPRPITSHSDFLEFLYGGARLKSRTYKDFLHRISEALDVGEEICVFTHGDVHMENIIVQWDDRTSSYGLASIVDWEMSGFYPEYFECIKATNTLATNEESDWFLSLPDSLTPTAFPACWLLDRLYDIYVS